MQKLINGIREFQKKLTPEERARFERLAEMQAPDCLFVACSDSRVVPSLFASTDPGDLFIVRNVGNIVPTIDSAPERAAVEFALISLKVRDIVVCGHSNCGAMRVALDRSLAPDAPHLQGWLDQVRPSIDRLDSSPDMSLPLYDRLSQQNVLQQLDHLRSFPEVQERLQAGTVQIHGWWFDIGRAEVQVYDEKARRFVPIC